MMKGVAMRRKGDERLTIGRRVGCDVSFDSHYLPSCAWHAYCSVLLFNRSTKTLNQLTVAWEIRLI